MGKWIHLDTGFRSYVNPESLHCQGCGKMIPKDAWISTREGKEVPFCDTECEALHDYMRSRRKQA